MPKRIIADGSSPIKCSDKLATYFVYAVKKEDVHK